MKLKNFQTYRCILYVTVAPIPQNNTITRYKSATNTFEAEYMWINDARV